MKKLVWILILLSLIIGATGWWYHTKGKSLSYVAPAELFETTDMTKYLAEVDEILVQSNVKAENITQEQREDMAKELALPSRLYKTISWSAQSSNWSAEPSAIELEKKLLSEVSLPSGWPVLTKPYNIEETTELFQALWDRQEFPFVEIETMECEQNVEEKKLCSPGESIRKNYGVSATQHSQCVEGTILDCHKEFFSYQKEEVPGFLRRKYENNTEATARFCYRNFAKDNCEQGYVISQRVGNYKKTTFCDAYINGKCQGSYILREESPACHCGPSVSLLEIKQNNGKWQYKFEEYTPHEISHKTTCSEYDIENRVCITGKYVQEETEREFDNEIELSDVHLDSVTYQIKNGKLLPGSKPLEESKPLLQLHDDVIVSLS